jgi:hypothetical protein
MPDQDLCLSLQQCQKKNARWPGTWQLAPKRAISLMPREPSQILIVRGLAWITWDAQSGPLPAADRDLFLDAGQLLDVPAGVHLVMESVDPRQSLDFNWRVIPQGLRPAKAAPGVPLAVLAFQWWQAWLELGRTSGRLLVGLWRSARVRRGVLPPGSVA